ncbi:MAG TPA: ATP-dependent DNA helicase RecG [Thermoanaerobaculia bacterium]|nr:ATP-dependent DNA helicase RecG [Thermoanaerobaculia bacterium]
MNGDAPLREVRGVGPARARALAEAGLVTVLDLLRHVPTRWEDRREVVPVSAVTAGSAFTLRGRLSEVRRIRTRRRGFSLVRAVLGDGSGSIPIVWFNQPYLFQQLRDGEEYLLHGMVRENPPHGLELLNPSCEAVDRAFHSARIVPVYSSVGSLGPAALRRLIDPILTDFDPASIPEPLPEELLLRRGLPSLGEALVALHRPGHDVSVAALNERRSPAHRRLAYEELLRMQVAVALLRARETAAPRTLAYRVDDHVRGVVRGLLPFRLTAAQKRVLGEIVADLRGPHPMLRLLQGDVGSGKTLVAALALAVALESGFQGAFMAPTELLAEQHFRSLERLLGKRYRVGLFVGAKRGQSDPRLRERLAAGEIQLAVGTHALIQEGVVFRRLGLAVVDEQHRFGVRQRALLRGKGDQEEQPDLLVMTATPIPRTLALTAWGDLEVSTLDELPPGRTPVATAVVPAGKRRAVYKKVREELAAGGRVYVVVPLIDESARTAAASLAEAEERVRAELAGWPCAVLHGRLPAAERDRVMQAFAAGEVKALLATTVIEVGVDVPEASCMVIESAERFGLAQLHQLRGRVGRGMRPSCCFAVHGRLSEDAKRRLEVFARTDDGFEIAEEDLKIRGPGDVLGTRQSGLPSLRQARLPDDWELLEQARDDARELLGRLGEEALEGLRKTAEGETAGWVE